MPACRMKSSAISASTGDIFPGKSTTKNTKNAKKTWAGCRSVGLKERILILFFVLFVFFVVTIF